MGKKSAQQVTPVDPTVAANAQTASNVATADAQQKLNMIGTAGPDGTVKYVADPSQPGGYTQTTTLSPGQQAIYDSGNQAQQGALGIANQQIGRVSDALGQTLNPNGVQTSYNAGGPIQTSFNQGGALQYGYNPGQAVQGQVGPQNLSGAYSNAADASYNQATSRLDPQYAIQQQQLQTQLANQGLSQNDDAYKTAMSQFTNAKTDAYNQANFSAQNQGLNAENTLFGQSVQQGNFANSAAAQQYAQNQGQAQFNNSTANQAYTQNLGAAQFGNTAQAQQNAENQAAAQFGNQALGQQFQQAAYAQNQPINQFNSLMSSGQVGMPTGINYSPTQVGGTDVLGAYALNQQGQIANQQAAQAASGGLMGGLMGLGSAAILASDRRLKTDIRLMRRRRDGVGVYRFRYHGDPIERIGVMAQELKKVRPDLVVKRADGFLAVSYAGLDLEAA